MEIRQGEGGKDRTVYLPDAAISLVEDWLTIRGTEPGSLLCPIRKGGQVELRQMTPQAVLLIVQKRAEQAGVLSQEMGALASSHMKSKKEWSPIIFLPATCSLRLLSLVADLPRSHLWQRGSGITFEKSQH